MTENNKQGRSGLRIAVDFDGVLFDHVPYVLRGFRDRYGIDLETEGMQHWDYFRYRAVQDHDLTYHKVRTVLREIETDILLHEEPPRDPHAATVMTRWMEAGHQVDIVTARHVESDAAVRSFLRLHGIPYHQLKLGIERKTGYDVLVDDAPHNVLMAAADGGLALLMDHPYNRDVPTHTNPLRVEDWYDVERLARQRLEEPAPRAPAATDHRTPPVVVGQ